MNNNNPLEEKMKLMGSQAFEQWQLEQIHLALKAANQDKFVPEEDAKLRLQKLKALSKS